MALSLGPKPLLVFWCYFCGFPVSAFNSKTPVFIPLEEAIFFVHSSVFPFVSL